MNVTKWIPGMAYDATITPATPSATCNVAIQLLDFAGNDLEVKNVVYIYISSDATGDATTIVDAIISGTDGDLLELFTDGYWIAVSEDDGDIDIQIQEADAIDIYLNVILPNGKIVTSEKIEMTG